MSNVIELCGWKVHWRVTESAGIAVFLVDFEGRRVLWEGSLPYVVVDHKALDVGDLDVDLEPGDAEALIPHGPFWLPLGSRTLVEPVRTNEFRGGFEIAADFVAGAYRYTQLWRFHDDGRIGPWLTIYGNGLHDGHTYHPHWRFDFDIDGSSADTLEIYGEQGWTKIKEEGWFPASGHTNGDRTASWRQLDRKSGAAVSIRPHNREDAELYALRYHVGEWPPFTPHGGPGGQPFPAAYVGAEPIDGEDVTLWYVAHVHFDHSFPFTAGPWVQLEGL